MKLLLSLTILLSPALQARIGDTPDQCDKRYGPPISISEQSRFYQKDTWGIAVKFADGIASTVTFNKGRSKFLTPREIGLLLDKNKLGGTWDHQGRGPGESRHWGNWQESLHATVAMQGETQILVIIRHLDSMEDEGALKDF